MIGVVSSIGATALYGFGPRRAPPLDTGTKRNQEQPGKTKFRQDRKNRSQVRFVASRGRRQEQHEEDQRADGSRAMPTWTFAADSSAAWANPEALKQCLPSAKARVDDKRDEHQAYARPDGAE